MTHFKIYMKSGVIHMIKANTITSKMTPLKFLDYNMADSLDSINGYNRWFTLDNIIIDSGGIECIEKIKNHFDFKELE